MGKLVKRDLGQRRTIQEGGFGWRKQYFRMLPPIHRGEIRQQYTSYVQNIRDLIQRKYNTFEFLLLYVKDIGNCIQL